MSLAGEMKILTSTLFLAAIVPAIAQVVIPGNLTATPRGFKTRTTGGGVNPGAMVAPAKSPVSRYITHIVLQDTRMWTSSDGKPLEAKLLAFEDLVADSAEAVPAVPSRPTVIRDGKVRLLVRKKPVEIALARLSEPDRAQIAAIDTAISKKAAGN